MNFSEKDHNYIESDAEREAGHVDTRDSNPSCDRLSCDLNILEVSVAG
jgi:hypothetical protein